VKRAVATLAVLALVFALLPTALRLDPYKTNLLTRTFLTVAAALSWNWLGGYLGQVSFGHAAMFGVGGFVAARLSLAGLPHPLAWVGGGAVAALSAVIWGHPALRLRGPYFSIATIGVGEAMRLVMTYWSGLTGGSSGLSLPLDQDLKATLYYWALALALSALAVSWVLRRTSLGLSLVAIKDDVDAATDVGVRATLLQDLVLMLSALFTGMAGGLYASFYSFIEPSDMFGFDRAISYVLMAVIGGVGTVAGPLLGAAVFVLVQQSLIESYPDLYLGLYGLLLVLVVLFEPLGVTGLWLRAMRLVQRRAA
jgi:branched-chain amino acid transport system permease protein